MILERHFNACQFIFENAKHKSPQCDDGQTPLHLAASNGHLEICKFLYAEVEDINPKGKKIILTYNNA